jgi:hypothetical protein
MTKWTLIALAGAALTMGGLAVSRPAQALPLQYPTDCHPGMRVADHGGRAGTLTRFDASWSYCYVRMDDDGSEIGYLYSLLDSGGGGAAALPAGVYECWGYGGLAAPPMRITGPGGYAAGGQAGRFRLEGSGSIVFESGPYTPYHAKLLSGGRIGLNANGDDSFYATSCELNRALR